MRGRSSRLFGPLNIFFPIWRSKSSVPQRQMQKRRKIEKKSYIILIIMWMSNMWNRYPERSRRVNVAKKRAWTSWDASDHIDIAYYHILLYIYLSLCQKEGWDQIPSLLAAAAMAYVAIPSVYILINMLVCMRAFHMLYGPCKHGRTIAQSTQFSSEAYLLLHEVKKSTIYVQKFRHVCMVTYDTRMWIHSCPVFRRNNRSRRRKNNNWEVWHIVEPVPRSHAYVLVGGVNLYHITIYIFLHFLI